MESQTLISTILAAVISLLLILTGFKRQPGIGMIFSILIIAGTLWLRKEGFRSLGFYRPENWVSMIGLSLTAGFLIQILAVSIIEPLTDRLTNSQHDHSLLDGVRGNWKIFLQWIALVWILVALLEETIFRGFLMLEISRIVGDGFYANIFNILFTSFVFGLAHWYQGPSGTISTGIVGIILGVLFIWQDYNLWFLILVHGFIDTIGIALIAVDGDKKIRHWMRKQVR